MQSSAQDDVNRISIRHQQFVDVFHCQWIKSSPSVSLLSSFPLFLRPPSSLSLTLNLLPFSFPPPFPISLLSLSSSPPHPPHLSFPQFSSPSPLPLLLLFLPLSIFLPPFLSFPLFPFSLTCLYPVKMKCHIPAWASWILAWAISSLVVGRFANVSSLASLAGATDTRWTLTTKKMCE